MQIKHFLIQTIERLLHHLAKTLNVREGYFSHALIDYSATIRRKECG